MQTSLAKPRYPLWLPGAAPAGVRLYMPLAEGAGPTAHDASRRSKDGTFVGSPTWQASRYGTRLGGFTTSDYVAIDPPSQILGNAYPFWMAALFVNTSTSFGVLAMQGRSSTNVPAVSIRINPGGANTIDCAVSDDAGTLANPFVAVAPAATDGVPHVIMGVSRTASDHRLYLDGIQVASDTTTVSTLTSDQLTLGVNRGATVGFPFPGEFGAFACGNGAIPSPMAFAQDWLSGRFSPVRSRAARTTVLFRGANPLYEGTFAATAANASFSGSATHVPPPTTAAFAATTTATLSAAATAVHHPSAATYTATAGAATFAANARGVAAPTTSEIQYRDPTGTTGLLVYAQRRTSTGRVWNGSSHVTFSPADWTTYEIPLADVGGGFYHANMPPAAAGAYTFTILQQAGALPASDDRTLGATPYPMQWNGSAEISLNNVSATVTGLPDPAPDGYGPVGTGSVAVDHDYPTANNLKFQMPGGQGIGGALVRAYLASEYAANPATATVRGQTLTLDSGAWANVIDLDPGAYKVVFKAEGYETAVVSLTVS